MKSRTSFQIGRRTFMAAASAAAAGLWLGDQPALTALAETTHTQQIPFRVGLSVDPYTESMLDDGITYRYQDQTARTAFELQQIFIECGSTEVWSRIGTSRVVPVGVKENTQAQLQIRARLARELNLPFNPELLLCGRYGDVSQQPPPDFTGYATSGPDALALPAGKQWHELSIDQMTDLMRTYGRIAAQEILEIAERVNVWDIGNEVEFGVAGVAIRLPRDGDHYRVPALVNPKFGQMTFQQLITSRNLIEWCRNELWPHVAAILAAVAEGIRQVDPEAKFATHSSTISTFFPGLLAAFHEAMQQNGFHADCLGTSWYPTSTAQIPHRLEMFKQEVELAKQRVGKPVYVSEYAYAAAPVTFQGKNWANPVDGYSISPEGSARMLRDVAAWGVQTGNISGIRPYGPDFVKPAGAGWSGMALFDLVTAREAVARPSLTAIQNALWPLRDTTDSR